jgi:hypothetical protein
MARPPRFSYFVGRPRFLRSMETRFGLRRPDVLLRREAKGPGVIFVRPCARRGPVEAK